MLVVAVPVSCQLPPQHFGHFSVLFLIVENINHRYLGIIHYCKKTVGNKELEMTLLFTI